MATLTASDTHISSSPSYVRDEHLKLFAEISPIEAPIHGVRTIYEDQRSRLPAHVLHCGPVATHPSYLESRTTSELLESRNTPDSPHRNLEFDVDEGIRKFKFRISRSHLLRTGDSQAISTISSY